MSEPRRPCSRRSRTRGPRARCAGGWRSSSRRSPRSAPSRCRRPSRRSPSAPTASGSPSRSGRRRARGVSTGIGAVCPPTSRSGPVGSASGASARARRPDRTGAACCRSSRRRARSRRPRGRPSPLGGLRQLLGRGRHASDCSRSFAVSASNGPSHAVARHTQSDRSGRTSRGTRSASRRARGLLRQPHDLLDRGVAVEELGRGLHRGDGPSPRHTSGSGRGGIALRGTSGPVLALPVRHGRLAVLRGTNTDAPPSRSDARSAGSWGRSRGRARAPRTAPPATTDQLVVEVDRASPFTRIRSRPRSRRTGCRRSGSSGLPIDRYIPLPL